MSQQLAGGALKEYEKSTPESTASVQLSEISGQNMPGAESGADNSADA